MRKISMYTILAIILIVAPGISSAMLAPRTPTISDYIFNGCYLLLLSIILVGIVASLISLFFKKGVKSSLVLFTSSTLAAAAALIVMYVLSWLLFQKTTYDIYGSTNLSWLNYDTAPQIMLGVTVLVTFAASVSAVLGIKSVLKKTSKAQ